MPVNLTKEQLRKLRKAWRDARKHPTRKGPTRNRATVPSRNRGGHDAHHDR